ncbi:hypothetical protein [Methylorubrum extorquens]
MDDMPETLIERVAMMEGILIEHATGRSSDGHVYEHLRREFIADAEVRALLPDYVRTCRTLDAFWPFIKDKHGRYQERRAFIRESFTPLIDHLEGRNRAPGDAVVGDALASFDVDGVHAVWTKALARRTADPEGAITVARTLLEAVCKHILDGLHIDYARRTTCPSSTAPSPAG